jgi:hypothetical protein
MNMSRGPRLKVEKGERAVTRRIIGRAIDSRGSKPARRRSESSRKDSAATSKPILR